MKKFFETVVTLVLIVLFFAYMLGPDKEVIEEFSKNKIDITSTIESNIQKGSLKEARALIQKYVDAGVKDKDLLLVSDSLKIKELTKEVKKIPASKIYENRNIYRQLASLAPNSSLYKKKLSHYEGKIKVRENIQKSRELKFGKSPQASVYDGTYREVKDYLAAVARDPDSVKVLQCSGVSFNKNYGWMVACNYQARNGFGGMNREAKWFIIKHRQVIANHPITAFKL